MKGYSNYIVQTLSVQLMVQYIRFNHLEFLRPKNNSAVYFQNNC